MVSPLAVAPPYPREVDDRDPRPIARLEDAPAGELVLRKPSWRSGVHLLEADGLLVGRLHRSGRRDRGRIEDAATTWTLARDGSWLSARMALLDGATGERLGTYRRRGWRRGGGDLRMTGGGLLGLHTPGWRRRDWIWTRDGEELATVRLVRGLGETTARARLTPAGRASGMGVLLVLAGSHLGLRDADESASAGGTAGAAA